MRKIKLISLVLAIFVFTSIINIPVQGAPTATLKSVNHTITSGKLIITANVDNFAGYQEIKWNGSLTIEHKIIIDFNSCKLDSSLSGKQISVNSKNVNLVRFGQFTSDTARMVIEVNGAPSYEVKSSGNSVIVTFEGESASVPGDPIGTPGDPGEDTIIAEVSNGEGFAAIDITKLIKADNEISISNITGTAKSKNYSFFIDGVIAGNYLAVEAVNDSILKNIKLFSGYGLNKFTGVTLTSLSPIYAKPVYIKNEDLVIILISKSSISESSVNAKIDAALEALGRVEKEPDTPPDDGVKFNNFTYYNSGDRVYFDIKKVALTGNITGTVKYYTEKWVKSDEYQITFDTPQSSSLRLGSGTKTINDEYLKWVSVTENSSTKKTTVTFKTNGTVKIIIMTNRSGSANVVEHTAITFVKPAKTSDKVIVIDPGHGGFDSGAYANSVKESDLNLDIGLRVRKYLKDRDYNVYMTRETDVFVGLYERAYIANELNAAIFMSIHNNAVIHPSDVHGTETLYTTADQNSSAPLKSRDIAMFVQTEMIKALGSRDRGYKAYNDLVVLKATRMPAALAEVGFVTSPTESAKLKDPAYRQKAAEAIAKGLIQSVNKL